MRTLLAITASAFLALLLAFALQEVGGLLTSASRNRVPAAVLSSSVFSLTNAERVDKDIPTLQRNALLDEAAQMKAQDMAAKGYYAHVSPDGVTPMYWVERAGYKYLMIGENLVVNRTDAEQVVDAFMGSPGHRANILRPEFTEIGVGVANGTYKGKDATFTVQIFAAPYPQQAPKKAEPKPAVKPAAVPVKAPSAPKAPVPVSVPRAEAAVVPEPKSTPAPLTTGTLEQDVKELISPILSSIQGTSTAATTTATTTTTGTPLFFLDTTPPIELAGVSQLESQTLPVQVGANWTMEFRVFVDSLFAKARGLFK